MKCVVSFVLFVIVLMLFAKKKSDKKMNCSFASFSFFFCARKYWLRFRCFVVRDFTWSCRVFVVQWQKFNGHFTVIWLVIAVQWTSFYITVFTNAQRFQNAMPFFQQTRRPCIVRQRVIIGFLQVNNRFFKPRILAHNALRDCSIHATCSSYSSFRSVKYFLNNFFYSSQSAIFNF